MRVAECGIDMFRQLVACTDIKIVPDGVAAIPGSVPIGKVAAVPSVAPEEVIEAVGVAGKPEPVVSAVNTQILDRLELKFDFGRLDIFKNNVVIRRPGPREAEEPLEAIVHIVVGVAVASGVAVKGADTWFPAMLEGITHLRGISMGVMVLPSMAAELIDQVEIEV